MTTAKCLFISILSTPNAKCFNGDLKDFYLGTPMDRYEYVCIPIHLIPPHVMELYKLHDLVHNGYVYAEIRKGMYGLPQAGIIANKHLQSVLAPHGYTPAPITPGLWRHETRDIVFCLVVDDFAARYTTDDDIHHLLQALKMHYKVSKDWKV